MQRTLILLATLTLWMATGCHWNRTPQPGEYRTMATDPRRDTEAARRYNSEAVALIEKGQIELAEKKLKAALAADLFLGPAHNNLGTVYYRQKKYYLAAWEYEYSAKLMPKRPEPRNNLGMVFEAVGRTEEAAVAYEKALALDPGSVEVAANLARVYVRQNRKDDRTYELLSEVALKDTRPSWASWARQQLALMARPQRPATDPAAGR